MNKMVRNLFLIVLVGFVSTARPMHWILHPTSIVTGWIDEWDDKENGVKYNFYKGSITITGKKSDVEKQISELNLVTKVLSKEELEKEKKLGESAFIIRTIEDKDSIKTINEEYEFAKKMAKSDELLKQMPKKKDIEKIEKKTKKETEETFQTQEEISEAVGEKLLSEEGDFSIEEELARLEEEKEETLGGATQVDALDLNEAKKALQERLVNDQGLAGANKAVQEEKIKKFKELLSSSKDKEQRELLGGLIKECEMLEEFYLAQIENRNKLLFNLVMGVPVQIVREKYNALCKKEEDRRFEIFEKSVDFSEKSEEKSIMGKKDSSEKIKISKMPPLPEKRGGIKITKIPSLKEVEIKKKKEKEIETDMERIESPKKIESPEEKKILKDVKKEAATKVSEPEYSDAEKNIKGMEETIEKLEKGKQQKAQNIEENTKKATLLIKKNNEIKGANEKLGISQQKEIEENRKKAKLLLEKNRGLKKDIILLKGQIKNLEKSKNGLKNAQENMLKIEKLKKIQKKKK